MRRVMALIGFSSFFVSLFCIVGESYVAWGIGIVSVIALFIVLAVKKWRLSILIILFATCIFSVLNFMIFDSKIAKYTDIYCHDETEICATLLDYPETNQSGFAYTFRSDDENKVKFTVLCAEMIDILPGDRIKGSFDFSNQYADYSDKIYFSAYVYTADSISVEAVDEGFSIAKLRNTLKQGLSDNTSIARGLTKAIVFGDKSGLSDNLYNDLLRCGLLHATATSGLHLTIVTGFVFTLLSFLGFSKKKCSVIAIVFIILFMIIIGFCFSLMRAGIMMIIYFAANLFDREGDGINSIGAAMVFLIAQNPYTVTSCSFLLSASATIGMILSFNPIYSKIENVSNGRFEALRKSIAALLAGAVQSLVAIVFTLPITYIYFGYFSIAGVFANAILSPLISIILLSGVIISLFFYVPVVPEILGGALDMVCLAVIKIVGFISDFKYCLINIDYYYVALFFFLCSVVIATSLILYYFFNVNKRKILRCSAFICFDLILVTILAINIFPSYDAKIKLQNSGSGICITAVSGNKMLVVDTGGKNVVRKVKSEVTSNCVDEISMMIVPSVTSEAFSSAQSICGRMNVDTVVCDKKWTSDEKYRVDASVINIGDVSEIKFADINIKIARQEYSDVLYLTNGRVSVLIIDRLTDCSLLTNEFKKSDIVVVKDEPPENMNILSAKSAVICTYEKSAEKYAASLFDTYSLRTQAIEIEMNDILRVKKV